VGRNSGLPWRAPGHHGAAGASGSGKRRRSRLPKRRTIQVARTKGAVSAGNPSRRTSSVIGPRGACRAEVESGTASTGRARPPRALRCSHRDPGRRCRRASEHEARARQGVFQEEDLPDASKSGWYRPRDVKDSQGARTVPRGTRAGHDWWTPSDLVTSRLEPSSFRATYRIRLSAR
jgi:hypothetical protein